MDARPCHTAAGVGAGAVVVVLAVEERVEGEVAFPRHVALGVDEPVDLRLHDDGPGELLPRPGQVAPDGREGGVIETVVGLDAALVEDEPSGLAAVEPALGGDDVLLIGEGAADDEEAVLEDGGGIPEDEIDGAGDDAAAVELPVGVGVEGVLVRLHPAVDEHGSVRHHPQRHRLVLRCAGRVAECHRHGHEPVAHCHCTKKARGSLQHISCCIEASGARNVFFLLTKCCGLESPRPINIILASRDDRPGGAIAIHRHVGHLLRHIHCFLVDPFFDVDHVPVRPNNSR
ncbi:hypothetical protein MUK42_23424 [Musa troglodytarum]|uniref:Uncharacterized protein n=1 Tax=Musa troglodytarum TaxID=320322 RepID=A0A9E7GC70_9LILI|nr:hypothetical protein MUK42_23424 [Musa troglodytarum]